MTSHRRSCLLALYGLLVGGGLLLAHQSADLAIFQVDPPTDASLRRMILAAALLYLIMAALPFVPAAEIGLGLMLLGGLEVACLMYLCTVLALTAAYLAGRAVPASVCAAAFAFFGFRKACDLVLQIASLDVPARLALLQTRAPRRLLPGFLRHRYLVLAFALNLPGNTLLGGGGGIALIAGLSGLYSMTGYLATVALAVAPVPLLIMGSALLR